MRRTLGCVTAALGIGLMGSSMVAAAPTKITFLSFFVTKNLPLAQSIIADFEQANPDIDVELQTMSYNDVAQQTLLRTASGDPPDVIDLHPARFYEFVKKGVFADLTPWVNRDLDLDDFYQPALDSVRVDGKIYALPQRLSTYVLFYNTDLFNQAGVAPPPKDWNDKSWNWDQLVADSHKLVRDTNGDGKVDQFGVQIDTGVERKLLTFLFQAGATIFDDDYQHLALGSDQGLQAIRYVQDGITQGLFGGSFPNRTAAAMVDIPPSMVQYAGDKLPFDVAALPQGPAGPATTIQPIPVGVVAQSKHPEEAWRFLRYYMSREVSLAESQGGVIVQPRRSVTGDPASYPQVGIHDIRPFVGALEVGRPVPNHTLNFEQIANTIDKALGPVWKGQQDAKTALAQVAPAVEALLKSGAND